jgi:hypothetical protein
MNTPKQGRSKVAKERKQTGFSREWRLYLKGQTWLGDAGSMVHTFDHKPTVPEMQAKSGDFEFVHECSVIEITTKTSARQVYNED